MFDAGANTKKNKKKIRNLHYHYLTLKPKKAYEKDIDFFNEQLKEGNAEHIEINGRHYSCVKKIENESTSYIFFSPELYATQTDRDQGEKI